MQNEQSNAERGTQNAEIKTPPADRMIRRPASTREVLGRDPKLDVFAGGTGLVKHPSLKRLHD